MMREAEKNSPVVLLENVFKTYRVYHHYGRGWLMSKLFPAQPEGKFYRDIKAVNDVSLTINKGEVVGLIGRNGAGKTTIVKLVAGLSKPTSGTVRVIGDLRAMLSIGIGTNQQFTGRENITFGSLVLGIPPSITRERMDEIIEFSELEDYIDIPMQFYSRGMRVRLNTAIAFQDVPDLLVLDEALGGGDGSFIKKVQQRIADICAGGSTVLFVSHSMARIERFCTRAYIIHEGRVLADGAPSDMTRRYKKLLEKEEENRLLRINAMLKDR